MRQPHPRQLSFSHHFVIATQWKVNDRSFNINDGNSGAGASADSELSSKAATLKSAMEDLSAFLEALSTTGIVSLPGGNDQPTAANINIDAVDDANVAVLELDGNDFFDNNKIQQMEIKNNAGADLIIINVGGTSITWNEGNMVGSFLTGSTGRSKLIWNFYEATLVDFKSKNMMGTVVAPYAHVKSQANIDGATAVASFYSQSEVHFPLLSVDCPYTTPPKEGGGGGDPHIQRWGREHDSFHGECDLVMIHSNDFHQGAGLDLHIRTTIAPEDYYSYMETAALRVGDYAIEVYKDMLYINGVEHTASMLPITFGGDFRYTISQAPIEEGKKEELHQYYKVDLHEDSSVLFRFYKEYLTVNVSGHPNDFSDATGLLGEYHTGDMYSRAGDRMDDFNEYGFEWQVQPNQDGNLFTTARSPQWPYERCRMPTSARPARRQLRGQQSLLLTASLEACANAADVDLCVDDCLTTGDVGLAGLW
jgi:choice-of-anchor A domain-containing protein